MVAQEQQFTTYSIDKDGKVTSTTTAPADAAIRGDIHEIEQILGIVIGLAVALLVEGAVIIAILFHTYAII